MPNRLWYVPVAMVLAACGADSIPERVAYPFGDVLTEVVRIPLQTDEDDPLGDGSDLIRWDGWWAIADGFSHNVKVFDPTGRLDLVLGRVGDGPGEFRTPFALAVDSAGRLAVLDGENLRVSFFDRSGAFDEQISIFGGFPGGLDGIDGGRRLLFAGMVSEQDGGSPTDHVLHIMDLRGGRLESFADLPEPRWRLEGPFLTTASAADPHAAYWAVRSRPEVMIRPWEGSRVDTLRLQGVQGPDWDRADRQDMGLEDLLDWAPSYPWLIDVIPAPAVLFVRFQIGDGRRQELRQQYLVIDRANRSRQAWLSDSNAIVHRIEGDTAMAVVIDDAGDSFLVKYLFRSPFGSS